MFRIQNTGNYFLFEMVFPDHFSPHQKLSYHKSLLYIRDVLHQIGYTYIS